ncbi:uncharacterized protein MONOS_18171 [Monocercomonoides exilis]|uniref:uncharacterized protein n=1 Tax=Monocercomonoides exilis TaxID=2049356 RepID=UPI003559E986|nr:hypothetical protein MONOS_18171 [Monocercomonoides exilis]
MSLSEEHAVFEIGRGAVKTAIHFLEQVSLREVDAPIQLIVLRNEGGASVDCSLYLIEVEWLNASVSDFPLFECHVTRGIVPAYGKR